MVDNTNNTGMPARKKKKKTGFRFLVVLLIVMAGAFLSTTVILLIGMMPSVVAILIDRTKSHSLGMTVASMNLAGCMPFIFELWKNDMTMETAMRLLGDPMAILIIYSSAAMGYVIDWAVTGIVASLLVEKAKSRLNAIAERQSELVRRWGNEVKGVNANKVY